MTAATLAARAPSRRGWRLGPVGAVALLVVALVMVAVVVGPLLWPLSPYQTDITNKFAPFSAQHPLGTDEFGRDILSRLLHGGRVSMTGAVIILAGTSTMGLVVGALAGLIGGWVDRVLSRMIDGLLSLPDLVVAFALVGVLGKSFNNILIALIATGWPWYARAYRGMFLVERRREYVEAATVVGVPTPLIVVRHVAPNVAGPVLVLLTVNLGAAILNLTALSFLGLGVQPPQAEWGAMVNTGRAYFQAHPWVIVAPGLAIAVTVLAVNLLGDALRDVFDPRHLSSRKIRK